MPVDAKTIQIFLPNGEPRGIRIAEITTRIVQAIQVPRTHLDRVLNRPELNHIGAYFLFGESEDHAKPVAYIGQTEDLCGRLKQHHARKEFWTTAVLLVSRTDSFTLAHIRYLEWYGIKQAIEAGRYVLDNGNNGGKPFITEPMEADVLDAFETGSVLLATLGFPLFEPLVGRSSVGDAASIFYCNGPDAKGMGRLVEDGFVVLRGSKARVDIAPSAVRDVAGKREHLIAGGILAPDGLSLRFNEDYLFESPSGAATMVLARRANGWVEWKTGDGRTLHEVERREIGASEAGEN